MLPAYLTGFSICSSSAIIPVTLKNGVSKETAGFVIPLCSKEHPGLLKKTKVRPKYGPHFHIKSMLNPTCTRPRS